MKSQRTLSRREVLALLGGAAVTTTACGSGGGGNGSPAGPTINPGDKVGQVSAPIHGHNAIISASQLAAGNGFTLNIRGNADHPHTVDLSNAEIVQIRDGMRVSKTSSNDDAHTHQVTFN